MKKTLKVVAITLGAQLVLGAGYFVWVLSTPDDALATITVSREWVARLKLQEMQRNARVQELEETLRQMAGVCELNQRYGFKGM